MQLSGNCVMSRAREKTDSLTAHKIYHGCCPSLEPGLARLGFARQQHLEVTVMDQVPWSPVQGVGER